MGQAIAGGLIASGWADGRSLTLVEVSQQRRDELAERFPGVTVRETPLPETDTLVAVKPHLVEVVCSLLDDPSRVVSIAAGVTVATIESALPEGTPVLRVMPNTPALVGLGASAVAPGSSASADDLAWARGILDSIGVSVEVSEPQIDAVTGLSGSGPAYVFLIAEALVDGAVAAGLPRDAALTLAHQTLLGAATMLTETGSPASELRAAVTTPAGTTAAGLKALEEGGVRASIINAVLAATDRAQELGRNAG